MADAVRKDMEGGAVKEPEDFKIFRTYAWCLPDALRDTTAKWHACALKLRMPCPSKTRQLKDAENAADKGGGTKGIKTSTDLAVHSSTVLASALAGITGTSSSSASSSSSGKKPKPFAPGSVNVMSFFQKRIS